MCLANPLVHPTALWPYSPSSRGLRLRYYYDAGHTSAYGRYYERAITEAMTAWSRAWPVIHFAAVPSANAADIVIEHGQYGVHGFWFDHAGLTVPSVTVFGCSLTRATVEINDSYLIHNGNVQYPEPMLRHLLLHEIGHALGLKHASANVASVMVPSSDAYRYDEPQPYDIRTIAGLYPPA